MSTRDTSVPLPGLQAATLRSIEARWQGFVTAEMRELLQRASGLSGTPIGNIDFTGYWYPEEPLPLFRPCLTLAIDQEERRWIAETGRTRGLPGPVWCIDPHRQVAIYVDRRLSHFLQRLDHYGRPDRIALWHRAIASQARQVWVRRYAHAVHVAVAVSRLKEIRGWLGRLPQDAWIYDLRAPARPGGLPYGLTRDAGEWYRCGRLPVFALCAHRENANSTLLGRAAAECTNSIPSASYTAPAPQIAPRVPVIAPKA